MRAREITGLAAQLRHEFDRRFAENPEAAPGVDEDLLGIGVGGDAYVLRLADIAGLFAQRPIVPAPSRVAAFMGLAGLRGNIVPVYSLRALLGYPSDGEACRWLVLAKAGFALAFERLDRHLRAPAAQLAEPPKEASRAEASRSHVLATVVIAGVPRALIDLAAMADTLAGTTQPAASLRES